MNEELDLLNIIHACIQNARKLGRDDLILYITPDAYVSIAVMDSQRFNLDFDTVWRQYVSHVGLCGLEEALFIEPNAQHPYVAIVGQQSTTWGIGILPSGAFTQFERLVEVN